MKFEVGSLARKQLRGKYKKISPLNRSIAGEFKLKIIMEARMVFNNQQQPHPQRPEALLE